MMMTEVIILRPSYAMYRFYAEVAGAKIKEVDYNPPARSHSRWPSYSTPSLPPHAPS